VTSSSNLIPLTGETVQPQTLVVLDMAVNMSASKEAITKQRVHVLLITSWRMMERPVEISTNVIQLILSIAAARFVKIPQEVINVLVKKDSNCTGMVTNVKMSMNAWMETCTTAQMSSTSASTLSARTSVDVNKICTLLMANAEV